MNTVFLPNGIHFFAEWGDKTTEEEKALASVKTDRIKNKENVTIAIKTFYEKMQKDSMNPNLRGVYRRLDFSAAQVPVISSRK